MTTFGNGCGVIQRQNGDTVLTGWGEKGMYIVDVLEEEVTNLPLTDTAITMSSLFQPTSLKQWHHQLVHCCPSTIQEMANKSLVDGLNITGNVLRGKCEDCILGRQTRRPFDDETEKALAPLELVSFDLWGPSRIQSGGGKIYFMPIIDRGTSYKHGAYLSVKSDTSMIATFDEFHAKAESMTGCKIRRLQMDRVLKSNAWSDYCRQHNILHEFTAPYSSAQNGLAECAIHTTMDDVRTLLHDSGLGHSFWAEAAAYSVHTRNVIPSCRHSDKIPMEAFTGKRQDISHLRVFGSRCWARIPTVNGVQVTGSSKLDSRGVECRFLGYTMTGWGNYKVQDVALCKVLISHDVIFEEGWPHCTLPNVEGEVQLFDTLGNNNELTTTTSMPNVLNGPTTDNSADNHLINGPPLIGNDDPNGPADGNSASVVETTGPCQSNWISQPSSAIKESREYQDWELASRDEGQDWANARKRPHTSFAFDRLTVELDEYVACVAETKASHHIPRFYCHAMATDPERWMVSMQVEMDMLKKKHTWDLVKAPEGANIMDSMWVCDIK